MTMSGPAGKWAPRRALFALVCTLSMLLATIGGAAAVTKPASYAEVIAQGVAPLSGNSMAWRVVVRQPDPAEEHPPIARHLGFTLVHQGTLLVTGYERKNDLTMLSPGEATFAREGEIQGRDQLGSAATDYWTIELVQSADARSTEGGKLVFNSGKFNPPDGRRNLQLIRDVVGNGEEADLGTLTNAGVILVTSGTIDLTTKGKTSTLPAGKAASISGVTTVTGGDAGGVFVVAKIGVSIEEASSAGATESATATTGPIIPKVPSQPTTTPAPTQTAANGMISVVTYLCPDGVTMAQATPDACGGNAGLGSGSWSLTGSTLSGAVEPNVNHGIWEWPNLAPGDYFVTPTEFPDGYSQYVIDFNPSALRQDTGLYVTLTADASDVVVNVYFINPGGQTPTGSATLGINFFECPVGTTVLDFAGHQAPHDCTQTAGPLRAILTGDALPRPLTSDDFIDSGQHPSMEGDWLWTNLPQGNYTLTPNVIDPNGSWYFRRPCGDQSCPEIEASGLEAGFSIDDGGFVLNVYYIPPSS